MRVKRYRQRQAGLWWGLWVIPLCLICSLGGILLLPVLPGLALSAVGFDAQGDIDAFWAGRDGPSAVAIPAAGPDQPPAMPVSDGQAVARGYESWFRAYQVPAALTIEAGSLGSLSLSGSETFAENLWVGEGSDGLPLGIVVYREDALSPLCARWLHDCATSQFRVTSVDFRTGGAVIYGSIFLAGLWQEAGLVALVTPDGIGIAAAGVVVQGMLYALPPEGEIAELVDEGVDRINTALRQATLQAGGQALRLVNISVNEDRLTFILR